MTPNQIQRFAEKHIPKILKNMGMPHIRPTIYVYDDEDDETMGQNTPHEFYQRRPQIRFNASSIENEEHLRETIVHECCHCVHAKAAYFFDAVMSMTHKQEHHNEVERCYNQMVEDIVENMLQMFINGDPNYIKEFLTG